MKSTCIAAAALLALSSLTACGAGRASAMAPGMAGFAIGLAINGQPDVEVVYAPGGAAAAVPDPEDDADAPETGEAHGRRFQMSAARNLLNATTMDACKAVPGVQAGWGHARVTFQPSGEASRILVDSPNGMSQEAVSCVAKRLAAVKVPEFAGAPVTVGATWNLE